MDRCFYAEAIYGGSTVFLGGDGHTPDLPIELKKCTLSEDHDGPHKCNDISYPKREARQKKGKK